MISAVVDVIAEDHLTRTHDAAEGISAARPERGLRDVLIDKALVEKVPTLGICLGMQLLGTSSDEGKLPGLGWLTGSLIRALVSVPSLVLRPRPLICSISPFLAPATIRCRRPSS